MKNNSNDERQKLRLTPDDAVLGLIRSGSWSQLRRRRVRRAVGVTSCLVLLSAVCVGVWRFTGTGISRYDAPLVAKMPSADMAPMPSTAPEVCHVPQTPVETKTSVPTAVSETVVMSADKEQPVPVHTEVSTVETASVDAIFDDIQSRDYATILWNDDTDADTIMGRLHSLLKERGDNAVQ